MENNFTKLLKELKTTNSNKDKEVILAKYKDDDYTQTLLAYNLNPYINFYIKKLPKYIQRDNQGDIKANYNSFIKLAEMLRNRVVTGHSAINATIECFSKMSVEEVEGYKKVLFKEAIGVGSSTVNKVFPGLVPTFEVMLASSELVDPSKLKYSTIAQLKLDGARTVYLPNTEEKLWGRSGKPIENIQLKEVFKSLENVSDWVLDGELYSHELSFDEIMSILNSEDKPVPPSLKFTIYDAIPLIDWENKSCKLNYEKRLKKVRELVQSTIADRKRIVDIEAKVCDNASEVVEYYKDALSRGYEGLMCKDPLGLYSWKRVTLKSGIMGKMKPSDTLDLRIINVTEGEGKYKGTLGFITLDLGNNLAVDCGSGFDETTRNEIWNNKNLYIGKTAEISYQEKTSDGSLRFPVFKRIRIDK